MRAKRTKWVLAWALAVVMIAGFATAGSASTAVKTTAGRIVQGALSGLAPTLRLMDPALHAGPAPQFDFPLDSIRQMWIDFPRVVIETADHVIVGPYSAFGGIAELLKIEQGGSVTELPFAAVEAIAFNGASFEPLPREWLGHGWLNQVPYVVKKSVEVASETAAAVAPAPVLSVSPLPVAPVAPVESENEEVVWNGVTPEAAEPAPASGGMPWWTALALVGGMIALFLFMPTNLF